jgi:hypothetical protein
VARARAETSSIAGSAEGQLVPVLGFRSPSAGRGYELTAPDGQPERQVGGKVKSKELHWKAISYGVGGLAGLVTQRLLNGAWKGLGHDSGPPVAADRRSSWAEALSWAVATGVGMGVSRLLAIRTAAVVWEATTHERPPGTEPESAS